MKTRARSDDESVVFFSFNTVEFEEKLKGTKLVAKIGGIPVSAVLLSSCTCLGLTFLLKVLRTRMMVWPKKCTFQNYASILTSI